MDLCWPELKPHPSVSPESLLRVVVSMNNVFITVYWLERVYVTSGFLGQVVLVAIKWPRHHQGIWAVLWFELEFAANQSAVLCSWSECKVSQRPSFHRCRPGGENTLEPGNSQDECFSARSINANHHQLSKPAVHSCDYSRWRQKRLV